MPAPRRGYGRGARILSVGIAATGLFTFAYFSVASHVLDDGGYERISLLWSVMFVIISVIYRPIEQLLSRTIADAPRARARRPFAARAAADPGALRASRSWWSRWRCADRSRTTLFDG